MSALAGAPAPDLPSHAADGPALRHGFSNGHIEALAWKAVVTHTPSQGMDREDRYEAAWGAIIEHLYAADEPPAPLELYYAARQGLTRMRNAVMRDHGYAFNADKTGRDWSAGPMSGRFFWHYWNQPKPPPLGEIVSERTAVWQVMAAILPAHAQTLTVLAAHDGNHQDAAAALGISPNTFHGRVFQARNSFLALWHEHETPPTTRRSSKRPRRTTPSTPAEQAA